MAEVKEDSSQLVIVGSSAGGIEALSVLVANLPADFPAPIVVAQHLDPERPSRLEDILSRRSTLPVRTVHDQETLEPGIVYLVPSNRHIEITHDAIELSSNQKKPKPSIDLLMRSAASVFGERLIAVILTGTGSDGAAGAIDVKRAGGTVIIQDPRTAAFPALPLSLSPTTVDIAADLKDMGRLFLQLLTGIYEPTESEDSKSLRAILQELEQRHGIDFQSYKRATILRRLQRRMAATSRDSIAAYYAYLREHPEEYQQLIGSFLIKVTEFFRDSELYDYLMQQLIPTVIREAQERGDELRIWSSGCATGEEAYSLAMLVCEALGKSSDSLRVRIFATDLDPQAIEFARRGMYPSASIDHVPPQLLERYFTRVDGGYQVKKRIRSLTIFGQHDLSERAPFPHIDLLTCRNVLIYFNPELQRHVLQLMAFSLRDGGYLVLGKAENTSLLQDYFVADHPGLKVYRRRGDRTPITPAHMFDIQRPRSSRAVPLPATSELQRQRGASDSLRASTIRERAELMLLNLPVGFAVIDSHYDIQSINTAARRTLGIHGTAVGEDFVHLAQILPSNELRGAIDAAFRESTEQRLQEIPVASTPDGVERYLDIACYPSPGGEGADGDPSLVVLISDVTEHARRRRQHENQIEAAASEEQRLHRQVEQLARTNEELLRANQDFATTALELRSANEEFLVGNQEMQAATEEVETLNEELQATNEELETLNEELQSTVEELNTTNDDLQARSLELQELAVSVESERKASEVERARIATVLASMSDAVLVVDRHGQAVETNSSYEQMFGDDGVVVGVDGAELPDEQLPRARAARGESFTMQFAVTHESGGQRWFEANGQPITNGSAHQGGVVVIRDVTDRTGQANGQGTESNQGLEIESRSPTTNM